jgi:hypothetical protein
MRTWRQATVLPGYAWMPTQPGERLRSASAAKTGGVRALPTLQVRQEHRVVVSLNDDLVFEPHAGYVPA